MPGASVVNFFQNRSSFSWGLFCFPGREEEEDEDGCRTTGISAITVLAGPSRPFRAERTDDMLAAGLRDRDDMRGWTHSRESLAG